MKNMKSSVCLFFCLCLALLPDVLCLFVCFLVYPLPLRTSRRLLRALAVTPQVLGLGVKKKCASLALALGCVSS
ncbi:hypothetical protein HDV57DRAFT_58776 [Trichoderma longibrachiatum]|uniref:Uncharacterized protein n=1 Tax=Trichoderma longibrachiatum ATCC 18648 TaxID=983965 RepID=A0A2T4CEU1_TRILO|nr:hypothetical protein M440DRAFT_1110721 [Trichoderma longibrachiatum ATCC 18648]